jgi:imidazolonepropionase-like amidohydrolase
VSELLIRGGRLIDGTGAPPADDAAVLVRDDEIVAVGTVADVNAAASPQATTLDATGDTIMPGLVDAHCHVTLGEPASNDELFFHREPAFSAILAAWNVTKLLRAGVTSFFDADGAYDIGPALRDAIECGMVEGPRMVTGLHALLTSVGGTAGRMIPDSGTAGYAQVVRSRDEMVEVVRRQIKYGADWVKIHATGRIPGRAGELQVWTLDEMRVVCDTAHELDTLVVAHCRSASSTRDAAKAGVDLIFHASFVDDEGIDAMVENGCWCCPTWTFLANLADFGGKVGASPSAQDLFRDEIETTAAKLREAYDAGVPFLTGSESGFSITPYGHWHARELQLLVDYLGLSPMQAIVCATANGRLVMRDDRIGTVEPGQRADLLVVNGDPLRDVRVLQDRSRVRAVVSRGQCVDLARPWPTRHLLTAETVSAYSTQPLTWDLVNP